MSTLELEPDSHTQFLRQCARSTIGVQWLSGSPGGGAGVCPRPRTHPASCAWWYSVPTLNWVSRPKSFHFCWASSSPGNFVERADHASQSSKARPPDAKYSAALTSIQIL